MMFTIDENDFNRTYDEKRDTLVLKDDLPVAVRDEQVLRSLGTVISIPGVTSDNALRLKNITNSTLRDYIPEEEHIWVNPNYTSYGTAWEKAGFEKPDSGLGDLDHLHSKEWAKKGGYGYVVLIPVRSGVNRSAGTLEKSQVSLTSRNHSLKEPIFYGNHIHWGKIWKLKIDLRRD
ncbi:hypothetical protein [Microbulbifer sp. GL-2]|uniref:hypothetical protein n=1 Tax=Microbulbifer sp. GL-2 TaxID=2591606 RepID=UPI00117E4E86|nr:hypothetical protein [Microbulbifer sp. GL-2]